MWPLIAISRENAYTIQLGIADFHGTRHTQRSLLMAANTVLTASPIGFFLAARRRFIATMPLSRRKG